jgi:hypothetical protein
MQGVHAFEPKTKANIDLESFVAEDFHSKSDQTGSGTASVATEDGHLKFFLKGGFTAHYGNRFITTTDTA